MMQTGNSLRVSHPGGKKLILIVVGALALILAITAGYFFWQYNNLRNNPDIVADDTTKRLIEKVGKLYALPTDEQPTVAKVSDKEKLKDQPFFKSAEISDYLLIYTNAKTAILYREEANKIINVGPVAITPEEEKKEQTSQPSTQPSQQNTSNSTTPKR